MIPVELSWSVDPGKDEEQVMRNLLKQLAIVSAIVSGVDAHSPPCIHSGVTTSGRAILVHLHEGLTPYQIVLSVGVLTGLVYDAGGRDALIDVIAE